MNHTRMDRPVYIDPQLESAITAIITCGPINCPQETKCFQVAKFARDQIRKMYADQAKQDYENSKEAAYLRADFCEQFAAAKLYRDSGSWEAA